MNVQNFCTACNKNKESNIYLKDRTVCKNYYKMKRRKNKNRTLIKNQQTKIDKVKNNKNSRTLIIAFSNSCKTFLMNHILHQNQKPFFKIAKALNQYPNVKAQTSDQIQGLGICTKRGYTFRNCNKTTYKENTPQTKPL